MRLSDIKILLLIGAEIFSFNSRSNDYSHESEIPTETTYAEAQNAFSEVSSHEFLAALEKVMPTKFKGQVNVARELLLDKEKSLLTTTIREQEAKYGLSRTESIAIYVYTGDLYKVLNPRLRKGSPLKVGEPLEVINRALKHALAKLPPYKGDVIRGIEPYSGLLKDFPVGSIYQPTQFLSTTLAEDSNGGYTGRPVLIRIHSKNGRDITRFTNYRENEVLFSPGSKFRVLSVEKQPRAKHWEIRLSEE